MDIRPAVPVPPDSVWAGRLSNPGWLLLPLRAFLGLTFCYAGLQKLANPDYLNPRSATSVASQMLLLRHSSPIGPLLDLSTHAPVLVGLFIAFGELAVGVGTILGLHARIAALGGLLLSLTFFLTVSWNTTPYYYGSDIVFVFGWLTLFGFGTGGVLSLQEWARRRAHAAMRLEPGRVPLRSQPELARRTVVQTGAATAAVAGAAVFVGALTAAVGRVMGGTRHSGGPSGALRPASSTLRPSGSTRSTTNAPGSAAAAPGTAVGATSAVPIGQARSFTDPASGGPAWVVQPSAGTFVAFNAICTHAGCSVQYDQSTVQFVCPCHGGVFDARTGSVLQGPPPAPLAAIPVQVINGQIRVDA